MIINNPSYNSLPEQVEQNRKDIEEIKESHLVDVDDELSTQSTNAVQNKVITEALDTEEFERKQADNDLDTGKVAKSNTSNILYGTDNDGQQTTYGIGTASGNIPKYDADARLQSASPNGNNDVANKQYVDNLTIPAENTYGTFNTDYVSQGTCTIQRVGKIVVVKVDGMKVDANTPTHEALLISGLPKPKDFFTAVMFPSMNNTFLRTQLIQSGNEGVIRTHYTSNSAYGDNEIVCTFVYIAE